MRHLTIGIFLGFVLVTTSVWGQTDPFHIRENDWVRGDKGAPVTILEYSDFTCGYCEKFFRETWPRLLSDYINTGKVRLVYRDFPRNVRGPGVDTALAAHCAGEQGRYWEMHDRLFSSKSKYGAGPLEQQAEQLGLDKDTFSQCFQSGRYLDVIFQGLQEGGSLGIRGTPGFVLYLSDNREGSARLLIPGAFPYEIFKEQIDRLLAQS
jgi:protein-disulfide isomerase